MPVSGASGRGVRFEERVCFEEEDFPGGGAGLPLRTWVCWMVGSRSLAFEVRYGQRLLSVRGTTEAPKQRDVSADRLLE